jgi:hypothetical protein
MLVRFGFDHFHGNSKMILRDIERINGWAINPRTLQERGEESINGVVKVFLGKIHAHSVSRTP